MFRVKAVCTLGMTGLVLRVLRPSEQTPVAMFRVTAARFRVTAEVYV